MQVDVVDRMRADWDQRAREDPHYYVAFARGQTRAEFLASAGRNIPAFEAELVRLRSKDRALEVGCGPGRLMLPMSRHFREIHGVDISQEMARLALDNLKELPNAHVHLTEHSDLRMFESNAFDFVYSYAVFQHIPSRAVVLDYLKEMGRVLNPGGILCCQLRGAPPAPSAEHEPATWTGCVILWDDVAGFLQRSRLQIVAVSGIATQHMMVTIRKPDPSCDHPSHLLKPALNAVAPSAGGPGVPQSGPGAAISLWLQNLPLDSSLLDFDIAIGGRQGFPCYLGPPNADWGYQLNALLPEGIETGPASVETSFRGSRLQPFTVQILPASLDPSNIVSITDGVNIGSETIRSGHIKVVVDHVADPNALRFLVDGLDARVAEFVCVDRVTSRYEFSIDLPANIRPGKRELQLSAPGQNPSYKNFG